MAGFMDDRSVAQHVLAHISAGSTDRGADVWREPVANYQSEERLGAELRVLRRLPTPFCPSAALPETGSFVAREAAGTPILVVRGRDGRVRAFRNACRHRGTPLASGSGCAKALVCPYHGWTYQLDGRLQHVPHEDGFPGLDKEQRGLVPVAAEEHLGLVFVTQEQGAPVATPWEGLRDLIAPEQQLMAAKESVLEVNWKVFLEGFIEGYHIRPAHTETFYPYGFDNLNLVEFSGPNSRVTYPFRRIEKLRELPPQEHRVDGLLTYVYQLFPNAMLTVLSRHTNLVVLEPLAVDRTRAFNYSLTNRDGGADAAQLAKRDADFVGQTGAAEDLALALSIQRSLGSGANEFFTFGHFEAAIVHFHRTLAAAFEAGAPEAG